MHIAIVTAGGAGMFCGSCMHDNAWARALIAAGHEVSLVPTYTPIRLDEPSVAGSRVFFGGINAYLDFRSKLWRATPKFLKKVLDRPAVINVVTRLATRNNAAELGDLTLAMLEGDRGPNRDAVEELVTFLAKDLKPDVVIFSNLLLSGSIKRLREEFAGPILGVLQGDDVFLDGLPKSHKQIAIDAVSTNSHNFHSYFAHSQFYSDYMANYLGLPTEKFHVLPLSIDPTEHGGFVDRPIPATPTVGYFARIAPEKGLHHLVDAVALLRKSMPEVRLKVGGYLGKPHRRFFDDIQRQTASWGDGFQYVGSPESLTEKVAFYQSADVISVPTEFQEPKGLYVLEAWANGTPVVQPAHGAFPELIASTGGGWLVPPRDPQALADQLEQALRDHPSRERTAEAGHRGVYESHSPAALAKATIAALESHH
jgi:glycosyltransferase involved in cell wall biosynthesis